LGFEEEVLLIVLNYIVACGKAIHKDTQSLKTKGATQIVA
jgi:hypothetical protein